MTMFWLGVLSRRPSALRPDLIAMVSSRAVKEQFLITTWSQDSGSQLSVFPREHSLVVTPSTITFVQSVGWSCQNWACLRVTPWISTLVQLYGSTNVVRNRFPGVTNTRCDTGTPALASACNLAQALL